MTTGAYRDRLDLPCPRCGVALQRYERRDKWRCPRCVGILLGAGELEQVGGGMLDPVDPDPPCSGPPCPACSAQMQPIVAEDIEVDRCVADRVVWFDAAELGLVVERAREAHEREELLTQRAQPLGMVLRVFDAK